MATINTSRRNFLKAAAVAAAATGTAGMSAAAAMAAEEMPGIYDGTADLPDAQPIPPVTVPEAWNEEADVVVVGLGGGGLAACVAAVDGGLSVIAIDKMSNVGGNTEHSTTFFTNGGSRWQDEAEFSVPSYPFDARALVDSFQPLLGYQLDYQFNVRLAEQGAACINWMGDKGIDWELPGGRTTHYISGLSGAHALGMQPVCRHMWALAEEGGAKGHFMCEATALVQDETGRIVGIQAEDENGNTVYYKGSKAVILTAGGMTCNFDLMAKYLPNGLRCVSNYGIPTDTGECIRMGLGVGAEMTGYNSMTVFDGGIAALEDGVGEWCHYLYSGDNQLSRQPWLGINKLGQRYPFIDVVDDLYGLTRQGAIEAATPNARGYVIFDNNWEANTLDHPQGGCRKPITQEMVDEAAAQGRESVMIAPWTEGVADAIERGAIKKADTIEEVAEMLGLDPAIVVKAVEDWNAMCEVGEDPELGFKKEWLVPIQDAPFYGIKIGAQIVGSHAGLYVNNDMQVLDTDCHPIPGLYAGFHTAGGAMGINNTCFTTLGNSGLAWTGGYMAANGVLANEL